MAFGAIIKRFLDVTDESVKTEALNAEIVAGRSGQGSWKRPAP